MTLQTYLEKNTEARQIFGKREIEIIQKQLLGLELTPSEKTRLSRDIRQKLKTINEISKYKEEFPLKKSQNIKDIINEAKEEIILETGNNLKEILLFGSYSKNKASKNSDVDLAIVLKKTDLKEATRLRAHILSKVNSKLDIQVYNILPEKIKKEIDKDKKIIFKNE